MHGQCIDLPLHVAVSLPTMSDEQSISSRLKQRELGAPAPLLENFASMFRSKSFEWKITI